MRIVFCLCLFECLIPSAPAAEKYALLIGVSEYQHARMNDTQLKYPEADANSVGDLLENSGYTVVKLLGRRASRKAITDVLADVRNHGTQDGVVVIGLFGHGVQYGENAYFAPYDTKIREVRDSLGRTIRDKNGDTKLEPDPASMTAMQDILDAFKACGAGTRLLLADCCREDPSQARGRAFGSNVRVSDLPQGTGVFFSCSKSEKAFEHAEWKHGAFTKAFLDLCSEKTSSGETVHAGALAGVLRESVRAMVSEKTNGASTQSVHYLTNGVVDLQLKSKRSSKPHMRPASPKPKAATPAATLWVVANARGIATLNDGKPGGYYRFNDGEELAYIGDNLGYLIVKTPKGNATVSPKFFSKPAPRKKQPGRSRTPANGQPMEKAVAAFWDAPVLDYTRVPRQHVVRAKGEKFDFVINTLPIPPDKKSGVCGNYNRALANNGGKPPSYDDVMQILRAKQLVPSPGAGLKFAYGNGLLYKVRVPQ